MLAHSTKHTAAITNTTTRHWLICSMLYRCRDNWSYMQWCIAKMEVGISKGAWQTAWRYPAYLWSLRWVYADKKNPEVGIRRIPAYTPPPIHHWLYGACNVVHCTHEDKWMMRKSVDKSRHTQQLQWTASHGPARRQCAQQTKPFIDSRWRSCDERHCYRPPRRATRPYHGLAVARRPRPILARLDLTPLCTLLALSHVQYRQQTHLLPLAAWRSG